MTRFIRLTLLAVITLVILALAVANRQSVPLYIDVLAKRDVEHAIEAPLFFIIFVSLFAGVLIGAAAMWMGQARWRRQAKARAAEVQKLKKDLTLIEKEISTLKTKRSGIAAALLNTERGLPN